MTFSFGRRAVVPFFLLLPLCSGAILCPSTTLHAFADADDDAEEAEIKAKVEADAAVRDAKTPLEKLNAYNKRASLAEDMKHATDEDWKAALADIDEAIKILGELEKGGATINGKANLFFRRGYILGSFASSIDYAAVIAAYDQAEAAGYEALSAQEDDKGAVLWNNRGDAKAHLLDYAGALKDFDIAVGHSTDWLWLRNRADVKFQLGNYKDAVVDWTLAKEKRPSLGDAPYDPAEAPLNAAVVASPQSAKPLIARSRFFIKKAKSAPMRVTTPADQDDEEGGDALPYYVSFSLVDLVPKPRVYSKLQLMQSALSDLNRAVKVEPASSAAWLERGRARNLFAGVEEWKSQRPFAADGPLLDFKEAARLDDKNAGAWVEVGRFQLKEVEADTMPTITETEARWIADKQLKVGEAIANVSRAIVLRPNSCGEAHFLRAFGERNRTSVDYHAVIVDYTAAIEQKLSPVDDDPNAGPPDAARLIEAHSVLGQIAMIEGRLDTAVAEFSQQIQLDAKTPDPYLNRGKIHLRHGAYDAAIADFDTVIKLSPKVAEAWWWRGVSHDGKDEVELAKADLAQAIKLDPTLSANAKGSRYEAQNPQPNVRLAPAPIKGDDLPVLTGTALDHKNAGNMLRGKNDLSGALVEYNNAIRLDPKFADAYSNRGSLYMDRGEYDLALADFGKVIENDPKHRVVYFNRGLLWRTLNEPSRERADFDKAIEYAATDAQKGRAYAERATTRYSASDKAGALADAKQGTVLAPQDISTWKSQGAIHLGYGMYADAAKSYRQALQLDPNSQEGHVNLAIALAHLGDAGAEAELKQGMAGATPEAMQELVRIIDNGIKRDPGSAMLKTLKADVEKAVQNRK